MFRTAPLLCAALLPLGLDADLVAHWKFDEVTGSTASDELGIHDATWVPGLDATPDWDSNGLLGGTIDFPGFGNHQNYFSLPSIPALNGTPDGMTISVWVKPKGQSGYRGILMTRNVNDGEAGQNYGLGHESDWIDGRVSGSGIDSATGTVPTSTDWIHLAWVWDNSSGTQKLFVNGTQSGTIGSYPANVNFLSNGEWRIGDDECCNNRNFNGFMDDLAVWDHPLSDTEVAELHFNGLNGYAASESPPPPNTNPLNVGVVINEIHYDPDPKTQHIEFIELLNTNDTPVDLSGTTISRGVDFVFPADTFLEATSYLIIAEDAAEFIATFPSIPFGTQVFEFDGSLSNEGETIALLQPNGSILDEVDYRSEFPWPISPNGEGVSMQLINGTLNNDLGASWRGAAPTPGVANSVFTLQAPPAIRQVGHSPQLPTSSEATTISAKVTDPDGVGTVELLYQIVTPGSYISAYLPLSTSILKSSPSTPLSPNPAFEDPVNWTTVVMTPIGDIYSATIPAQAHRALVRYRIRVTDTPGNSVRVPYSDDPSLNFAYFSYDGVPNYTADLNSVHPDGAGHTYSSDLLSSLPVYHLITDPDDLKQCWAYNSGDRVSSVASRKTFNWEGAMVYDDVVYDHIAYRLRQRNDRYAGQGRRSMRFRFQKGHYLQAHDPEGNKYPVKWRSMNTSKMSRFAEGANHGMRELVSSRLWNLAGVIAPEFQHVHFRVIDDAAEFTDQYNGDFYGLSMIFEHVDAQFLESREMPRGNVYKLKDGESNPFNLQKYQARDAVTDGSDFLNIRNNLGPPDQSDQWLREHVDWDSWYLYAALGEGFRHYDFAPYHQKNRIWYFKPDPINPLGLMSIIPHDTDATWKRGTNDSQWNDPSYGPGDGYRGRVVGIDLPKEAIQEITGLDETDGENHPEREAFMLEYRNVIREVRDLLWQPETVNSTIDAAYLNIAEFSLADRDRWDAGPNSVGNENIGPLEDQINTMKSLAFTEDLYMGSSLAGGRAQWLVNLAVDAKVPIKPAITYTGPENFPAGSLSFDTTSFNDPDGNGTFAKMEWRIAESGGAQTQSFLATNHIWKYYDLGDDPGANWHESNYSDATWQSGASPLGYGDNDEETEIDFVDIDPAPGIQRNSTSFFRTTVNIPDAGAFDQYTAQVQRDDGVVIYLNGEEVYREEVPGDTPAHLTYATQNISGTGEDTYNSINIPASKFVDGDNTIAVSIHQDSAGSSDISFDLLLGGSNTPASQGKEWNATWESGELTTFQSTITPPAIATRNGLTHRARVRHQDTTGRWSQWSDPVEFTAGIPDLTFFRSSLVITEIMYHPADPTTAEIAAGVLDDNDFEFIEIRNVGDSTVSLLDVRFTKGIDFDFAGSAITSLTPGEYALVVNNLAAFEFRYGTNLPVAGEWSGNLSNGGERLKLTFGAGESIHDFNYDDEGLWPEDPDQNGGSLVLRNSAVIPDHNSGINWRTSLHFHGTPGSTDNINFLGGNANSLIYYATGGTPPVITRLPDGNLAYHVTVNLLTDDLDTSVQLSHDLQSWSPANFIPVSLENHGNNRARITYQTSTPPADGKMFLRYRILKR
ncbi:lamin tail domain-containing protein [Akkermansiaceae bacterium]|nr:lamin tail domain-containing protein [Akkermansiaceae bacterium]